MVHSRIVYVPMWEPDKIEKIRGVAGMVKLTTALVPGPSSVETPLCLDSKLGVVRTTDTGTEELECKMLSQ